jgi:hypothetical protein
VFGNDLLSKARVILERELLKDGIDKFFAINGVVFGRVAMEAVARTGGGSLGDVASVANEGVEGALQDLVWW